jgi:pimeloyl-ACP methyl ester carboxylesterase
MKEDTPPLTVVLVHGAWADGSSWRNVITPLHQHGIAVTAAPIPLTSLSDDVTAVDRAVDRVGGPVVLVGHAYAGAVIGASAHSQVKALVYIAALAPDTDETVADVFYRASPNPQRPSSLPTPTDISGYPPRRSRRHSRRTRAPRITPC